MLKSRCVSRLLMIGVITICLMQVSAVTRSAADEPSRSAEQSRKLAEQIERLIRGLDDDAFQIREESQRKLIEIGLPAWDAVLKATKSSSPEVRSRTQRILKKLTQMRRAVIRTTLSIRRTFTGHTEAVTCVAFSPDGTRIVSGSGNYGRDGLVKVWDVETGQEIWSKKGHTSMVYSVAFSPDGTRIVSSGGVDGGASVKVWDAVRGKMKLILSHGGDEGSVIDVAFSPDGKRIAGGGLSVKVWDAVTGQVKWARPHPGGEGFLHGVAFSPDGKRIAGGGDNRTVTVWDAVSGQEVADVLRGHTSTVYSVAFSPDGKRIVSASRDKTVRVWDVETRQEIFKLGGHFWQVKSAAFSPDGKHIVSGDGIRGASVTVWDAVNGLALIIFEGHTSLVQSVAFSPDGKRIASGSRDHTVKLWDLDKSSSPAVRVQ